MHEYVHGYAKDHNIEMMRRVYDRPLPFRPLSGGRDVLRGEVIEVTASGTTLRLFDGTTITAYASSSLNSSVTLPEVGDTVVIFGVFDSETHFSIEKIRQMGDGGMGGMMGKREKRGEEQMMIR